MADGATASTGGHWSAVLATVGEPDAQPRVVEGVLVVDVSRPESLVLALEDTVHPVLVVCHHEHAAPAATAAGVLQGHRPDLVVGHLSGAGAPVALLAALVVARETASDAGHGAATWQALLDATWSACLLSSVTGLTRPNPGLALHLRSWWPASRFLVRLHPEPAAVVLDRAAQLLDVERGTTRAVLTEPAAANDAVTALVKAAGPVEGARTLPLPGRWDDVLSRPDQGQLALLPADPALLPVPGPRCPLCQQSVTDAVCLFCRVRSASTDDRDGVRVDEASTSVRASSAAATAPGGAA